MTKSFIDNKQFPLILAIIFIIGIVIVAAYVYSGYDDKKSIEEPEEQRVDTKISPYTNQAVFLEIHRIRKKGIIEQMYTSGKNIFDVSPQRSSGKEWSIILDGLRPGKGWDEKPSYRYQVAIDDYEWEGKDTYTGWDTGYMNQQIFRNVEDEQLTTAIEFSIIENVKIDKLIGSSTQKKEQDSFTVEYDFRTGRWTGDDSFNDSDGYGHFNGTNFEVWFSIYQTSADEDIIPYQAEIELGTDPLVDDTYLDPDGDGIPTVWEWKWGYDPFTWDNHSSLDADNDGLSNLEEYYMRDWLANPYQPEIYIETDYMQQTPKKVLNRDGWDGWRHEFYEESQQMLMERFNQHGYTVHIDDGCMGEGGDILPFARGNGAYNQDTGVVAGHYANDFPDERKGIFRYLVVAYGGGWCHPQDSNHWYDCMVVPHNQKFFMNQLDAALTDRTKRIGQAIQIIHELGHSLGIVGSHSPGVDNASVRNNNPPDYPWFDYVSVMNYDYFRQRYFDYSDGTHGEYDTDDWAALDLTFFQTSSEYMEGIGAYD
ncbi:MAG: hypothetical protein R6U21_05530 [Thermoplasmatota archaeon]